MALHRLSLLQAHDQSVGPSLLGCHCTQRLEHPLLSHRTPVLARLLSEERGATSNIAALPDAAQGDGVVLVVRTYGYSPHTPTPS
jgi:hypothetical protein